MEVVSIWEIGHAERYRSLNISDARVEGHRKIFEGFGNDLGGSSV